MQKLEFFCVYIWKKKIPLYVSFVVLIPPYTSVHFCQPAAHSSVKQNPKLKIQLITELLLKGTTLQRSFVVVKSPKIVFKFKMNLKLVFICNVLNLNSVSLDFQHARNKSESTSCLYSAKCLASFIIKIIRNYLEAIRSVKISVDRS